MKNAIMILLFVLAGTFLSHAQVLRGRITSQSGEPIPYSTVYIQELKQGTTTNTKGDYEIRLPAGKYTVICQSLGYEPIYFNVTLTDIPMTKDIILPLQYYQIPGFCL